MRDDFEKNIKPRFTPGDDDDDDDDEDIWPCNFPPGIHNPEKRLRKRKIELSKTELKDIFEPTFIEITRIVQKQVTAAQAATGKNVDVCVLPALL